MTPSTWALMSAVVLMAAFVQGSTGFGFALIVAPTLGLFAPALMPVSLLLLMLPLNFLVAWRERNALDARSSLWITLGRIVGTVGGLALMLVLSVRQLNALTGLATIVAASLTLLLPAFTPARRVLMGAGLVTGVTETTTGIGGPPLALVYQHQPAAVMRSTLAACFLIGELVSLGMLWATGRSEWKHAAGAIQLVPALIAGAMVSKVAHVHMNPRGLRFFVVAFSMASGAVLLLRA
jgi:uncharacterized membrane protein YfcA